MNIFNVINKEKKKQKKKHIIIYHHMIIYLKYHDANLKAAIRIAWFDLFVLKSKGDALCYIIEPLPCWQVGLQGFGIIYVQVV